MSEVMLGLSLEPASRAMLRRAVGVVLISAGIFVALLPLAALPLTPVVGFIPVYESALIVFDLVTAILLFGQFTVARSRALGLLAAGYLFTALVAGAHLATFPGLFAPQGLLGAGAQSTAWLYMIWHGGFPLFVIAYALASPERPAPRHAVKTMLALLAFFVAGGVALTTAGEALLPAIMDGQHYTPVMKFVVGAVWLSCPIALLALWRGHRTTPSVLRLWLSVVMVAWFFDIGLSAVFNAGRFDLGFYAGRVYGLLAAGYVLFELLVENGRLYRQVTAMHRSERARADELAVARDAALAADRAKGRFLATMSHEIRTPMNAILGLTHLALDGTADPRLRDYLGKVHMAARSLMRLLDDILDYSKVSAGRMTLENEEFEIEAVVDNVVALFAARADQAGLDLLVEIDPRLPRRLRGDPLRLTQVLSNLIGNAIKFTPQGQVVVSCSLVEVDAGSALIRITVEDSGIGLSAEQLQSLFEPFVQAEASTTRRFGGTGLGLAICKQLMDLMGGQIETSSALDRGTSFALTLRLALSSEGAAAALTMTRPRRTLIVDAHEASAAILRRTLESWRFEVETAASASQALARLRAAEARGSPLELVLLDENVGDLEDEGLARKLRWSSDPMASDRVSILTLVSASSTERSLALAGAITADRLLTKPVTPSRLFDAIAHLGKPVAEPAVEGWGCVPEGSDTALRGCSVLLAEDNLVNQQVATELLARAGVRTTVAANGVEAVQQITQSRFDLVLMDLQMPLMDGLQATRLLRRLPHGADVPVVGLTASALEQDRLACLEAGMNAHLSKPIVVDDLLATLRRLIVKPGEGQPEAAPPQAAETATLARRLPGLNLRVALERLGGNTRLYRGLLGTYVAAHRDDAELADRFVRSNDVTGLARLAHALAGSAAVLGIEDVALIAQRLAGAADPGAEIDVVSQTRELRAAHHRVLDLLRRLPPAAEDLALQS